ncbi:MAG: BatD family protein [Bdellovibrionota bacterium]|jgi:hypothetical protein
MNNHRYIYFFLSCFLLFMTLIGDAVAENITAYVQVENQEVYLGDSFGLQIVVIGETKPDAPDLEELDNFKVETLGVSNSSSSSISIINGRRQESTQYQYVFNYRLTPKTTGTFTIPSFTLSAAGESTTTKPLKINVVTPKGDPDYKLRLTLSKDTAYVGEALTLNITWYLASDASNFNFSLPILDDPRFAVHHPEVTPHSGNEYIRFPLAGRDIFAKKSSAELEGKFYTTISFQQIIIPKQSGEIELPKGVVTGKKITGYSRQNRRTGLIIGDPFFDDFFNAREPIYQRFAIPSNQPKLTVKEVPSTGKPYDFTGLIGDYSIIANATPTDVNVGDPITLTIEIAGPNYMGNVSIYPLEKRQELTGDFKVPVEMAAPKIKQGIATFTQTIRPLRPDVKQIPPLRLSYFDSSKGKYLTTSSDPIPLKVTSARIVTAQDAEGTTSPILQTTTLKTSADGIVYNYTDTAKLLAKEVGATPIQNSPFWMFLLIVPCGLYLIILGVLSYKRLSMAGSNNDVRSNIAEIKKLCHDKAAPQQILSAFRNYLSKKLLLSAGSTTFKDIEPILQQKGISSTLLEEINTFLQALEAASYAGADDDTVRPQMLKILNKMEKEIK